MLGEREESGDRIESIVGRMLQSAQASRFRVDVSVFETPCRAARGAVMRILRNT
jgi:hypothetical protein